MALVLLFTGIIVFIYGVLVVAVIGLGHWSNLMLCGLGLFLILLSRLWKFLFRRNRTAGTVFAVLLAACFLLFAGTEAGIIAAGCSEPRANADWAVLLGAKVYGSGPSMEFEARIRACEEYLKANPETVVIVSGGQGADEPVSEAEAAKKQLLAAGIAGDRILTEDLSTSTEENLACSAEVIRRAGGDPAGDPVVIVSSSFHLFRAFHKAQRLGYGNVSGLGCTGKRFLIPYYYIREFAACAAGILTGR